MKSALFLFVAMLLVLVSRVATADTPTMTVSADPKIEVGAVGKLKIQVIGSEMADEPQVAGANANIQLGAPSTFSLMMQGQPIFTATWMIKGRTVGNVTLTPSVTYGGKRVSAKPVTITIVTAGAKPNTGGGQVFQFGFPLPFDVQIDDPGQRPAAPKTDPELALEAAPFPIAFLRATIDKKNAVVGEQVIFEMDLYSDDAYDEPDFNDAHEAPTPQFVRHSLMKDDSKQEKLGMAMVAGRVWNVKRIRRAALFPMEAGDLAIGAMNVNMISTRSQGVRFSDPLTVHVVQPPAQGRPPGYAIGDVCECTLTAEVSPREVKRGDVATVRVVLDGKGNVPASIPLPARKGMEWMDSEVHDQIGRIDADHWGGTKTLVYVVRMLEEGDVELGDLALPVWNPQKNAYDDLRATLGKVHVLPGSLPDPSSAELPPLPPSRNSLAGLAARKHLDDSPFFWMGLLAPAAIFASAAGARSAVRRARERLAARAISPERELGRRMRDAEEACASKDSRAADAAVVRALEQSTIVRRSTNVRGVTKSEATRSLEAAGVKSEIAAEITGLLRECEDARFSREEESMDDARKRWARARKAMEAL